MNQNKTELFVGSVQFSCTVVSDSLRPHELQHARPPCPSPTPGVHPNSCPLSRWCHPTISSFVIRFFSCSQSLPASGSFQMSHLFTSGGQSIEVSASTSVLPMNTQDWSHLGWTGWISMQSKGLSRVFLQHHSSKESILWCLALQLWTETANMKLKDPCSLKEKLWPWKKSILKSIDITLPTKIRIVKAMAFPAGMYRCEN